jgi:hypothetical protein
VCFLLQLNRTLLFFPYFLFALFACRSKSDTPLWSHIFSVNGLGIDLYCVVNHLSLILLCFKISGFGESRKVGVAQVLVSCFLSPWLYARILLSCTTHATNPYSSIEIKKKGIGQLCRCILIISYHYFVFIEKISLFCTQIPEQCVWQI